MFDEAEKIIEGIGQDCPDTGKALTVALDGLRVVSCDADAEAKPGAFEAAAAAIEAGRKDCPDHTADFDRLAELLDDGEQVIDCSGGG